MAVSILLYKGWPYEGDAPDDPEYLKDRNKVFKENGNGWWWHQGFHVWKKIERENKRR